MMSRNDLSRFSRLEFDSIRSGNQFHVAHSQVCWGVSSGFGPDLSRDYGAFDMDCRGVLIIHQEKEKAILGESTFYSDSAVSSSRKQESGQRHGTCHDHGNLVDVGESLRRRFPGLLAGVDGL